MTRNEFLTTIVRLVKIYRIDPSSLYYIIDAEHPTINAIAVTRKSISDMLMIYNSGLTEEALDLLDFRSLSEAPIKGCIVSKGITTEMAIQLSEKISPAYIYKHSPKIHMPS